MGRRASIIAIAASAAAILLLHAGYYYPFVPDDAFISLRYAQRLLQGHGLTWTGGPPVEGYSNFLWVLLVAGMGRLGIDLIVAARILGGVSSLLVVGALLAGSARYRLWSAPAAAVACIVWVSSGPIGAWTLAGLAHPLVAALLSWVLVIGFALQAQGRATFRALQIPGALLGVLALVRLDAPLFVLVFAFWWWAANGRDRVALRNVAALLLAPALALGAQQIFRVAYYGDWLPNVAHAKLTFSGTHLISGLHYVVGGLASQRPLTELAFVGLLWLFSRHATGARAALLLLLTTSWLAYVALIGRDLFPAWRQLIPVILFLTFAVVVGFDEIRRLAVVRQHRSVAGVLGVAAFAIFVWNQARDIENQRAKTERWEWNGEVVGRAIKKGFGASNPTLAIMAAGAVPYWAEIDCLDMFGLADRHIAKVRTAEWGEGKLGHETRDAEYVLSKQPDLILFGTPGGYEPSTYVQGMGDMPAFRDNYERCNIAGDEPRYFNSRVWVNRNSTRIGIRADERSIVVPPYLLNLTGGAIARLDDQQRFYVETGTDAPVGVKDLNLPSGRWIVAEPTGAMRVLINHAQRGFREASLDDGVRSFVIDSAGRYDVLLVAESGRLRVSRLLLVRD